MLSHCISMRCPNKYTHAHVHERVHVYVSIGGVATGAMLAEGERTVAAREGASDYRLNAK